MTEQNSSDCEHLDFEKELLRGCTIGRIAPGDCKNCEAYLPKYFMFADLLTSDDEFFREKL